MSQNQQIAIQLVNQFPSYLSHRTTLALAALRMNEPAAALDVYKGLDVKWELAPMRFKAIYAAVLNANGQKEEALKIIQSLRPETLRLEEQQLIKF